jgi:hypothetical protein
MEAKGFVVPPGGGVWDMEPGRSAALKLVGGQTAESVMLFEETAPPGTATIFICTTTATRSRTFCLVRLPF